MKVKAAIKKSAIPRSHANGRSPKYGTIWAKIRQLKAGEFIPVACSHAREARNLYMAALTHRTLRMAAKQRGLTIFIGKAEK